MKIINLIMITLWMTFLSSCRTQIICAEIKKYKIKPVVLKDISFQFNRCRARCFDMNDWETLPLASCPEYSDAQNITVEEGENGAVTESINLPITECEGLSGYGSKDIAEKIRPNVKALSSLRIEACKE